MCGRKKKTEKKSVEFEKDVTFLKDTRGFVDRLIAERGMWAPDILKRISIDKGDNSLKFIINLIDKNWDPEITFTRTEKPGNLCSGVKQSIILAYVENVSEDYENIRLIMELLRVDELDYVVAADMKLLNVLLGLCGHGGKYACIYCEGEKGLEAGNPRTFSNLIHNYNAYVEAGSKPKLMQKFKNVINLPLIKVECDQKVDNAVPPPELHLMMGAVNHKLALMWQYLATQGLEHKLWEWCDSKGVTRRGYNGVNKLDGNNSAMFLENIEDIRHTDWFPEEATPIVDCLLAFRDVKDSTFSLELKNGWENTISLYTSMFSELQVYSEATLGLHLTCTWKIHIICCHLSPFLSKVQCGMANYSEQTGESIHARLKPILKRDKRKEMHKEHIIR